MLLIIQPNSHSATTTVLVGGGGVCFTNYRGR